MGFLTDVLSTAAGFIPGVGPFISKGIEKIGNSSSAKSLSEGISGAVAGLPGAYLKQSMDRSNSARAFESSMGAYKTRYQNTAADMRAAGLNPVLAASGGFNVGSAPTRPPIPGVDIGSGASSAKAVREVEQMDTARDKMVQDIKESKRRVEKMGVEIFKIDAQAWEAVQKTATLLWQAVDYKASAAQKRAAMAKINQEIKILVAATIQAEQVGKIHSGVKGAVINYIAEIRKATGITLSFSAAAAMLKGKGKVPPLAEIPVKSNPFTGIK